MGRSAVGGDKNGEVRRVDVGDGRSKLRRCVGRLGAGFKKRYQNMLGGGSDKKRDNKKGEGCGEADEKSSAETVRELEATQKGGHAGGVNGCRQLAMGHADNLGVNHAEGDR